MSGQINPDGKCQYCNGPSPGSYTCEICRRDWPHNSCRCENNGDYCDVCLAFIEYRSEQAAEAEMEAT